MTDRFFEGFGIEILRRNNQLFIRYDAGHFVIQMVETEITEDEAQKAQISEQDAYEVILETQRRSGKL